MSQLNRPNLLTDIINNIYTNVVNYITGNNLQNRLKNIVESTLNILTDANQADGYVATSSNNEIDQQYVIEQIHVSDLQAKAAANQLNLLKQYYIDDSASGSSLILVRAATFGTLFQQATDLTTGETGVYDLSTDSFYPLIKTFTKTLSTSNIIAGGSFDISQLPAISGAYWRIESAEVEYTHGGIDFDGSALIWIVIDSALKSQLSDYGDILAAPTDVFTNLSDANVVNGGFGQNIVVNKKAQVKITNPSTVGNGSLKIYGRARLITT